MLLPKQKNEIVPYLEVSSASGVAKGGNWGHFIQPANWRHFALTHFIQPFKNAFLS